MNMPSIVIPQDESQGMKFGQVRTAMAGERDSTGALEQSRRALSSSNAHGDDAVPRFATSHFVCDGANHARTCHTEGMANGNRAPVNIEFLRVDTQTVAAINHLDGESFVHLPEIDIARSQAATA